MTYLATDIFSIQRKRKSKPHVYRITWPCGATWLMTRTDLEVPVYVNGEENGVTCSYKTLREARDDLEARGCKVGRI